MPNNQHYEAGTEEADRKDAEIARLRAEVKKMTMAVDTALSERMVAAGMVPVDELTKPNELSRFEVHAGMTDMAFFEVWLERKAKTYARMQAAHQIGENILDDDIADFVLGKAGAFNEALLNYRAALSRAKEQQT